MDGFRNESNYAKVIGFDGKLTLHPEQILELHKVFQPSREEVEEATNIVTMWEQSGDGKGSIILWEDCFQRQFVCIQKVWQLNKANLKINF